MAGWRSRHSCRSRGVGRILPASHCGGGTRPRRCRPAAAARTPRPVCPAAAGPAALAARGVRAVAPVAYRQWRWPAAAKSWMRLLATARERLTQRQAASPQRRVQRIALARQRRTGRRPAAGPGTGLGAGVAIGMVVPRPATTASVRCWRPAVPEAGWRPAASPRRASPPMARCASPLTARRASLLTARRASPLTARREPLLTARREPPETVARPVRIAVAARPRRQEDGDQGQGDRRRRSPRDRRSGRHGMCCRR